MEILTKKSFQEAIKKCEENERDRVLVVTKYLKDQDVIRKSWIPESDFIINVYPTPQSLIPFTNGSSIKMISVASQLRGQRADLVLYAPEVLDEDEYMLYVLQPMEMRNMSFSFEE